MRETNERKLGWWMTAVVLAAGSTLAQAAEPPVVHASPVVKNGISLTGTSFNGSEGWTSSSSAPTTMEGVSPNGVSPNGVSPNGVSLNGVSLNGVSLNGVSLNGVSLNGSQITGVDANGRVVGGAGIVGATFSGTMSDGTVVTLRADSARLVPELGDVYAYQFSLLLGGAASPLCYNVVNEALALRGSWDASGGWVDDPKGFTLSCRFLGAIAKCVELGYKPWTSKSGVALRNHHQACTRMLRADYCGNGTPYTMTGWPLNVYDGLAIQTYDATNYPGISWLFDGEWDASGARCWTNPRHDVNGVVPGCAQRLPSKCGRSSHFSSGALIMESRSNSY